MGAGPVLDADAFCPRQHQKRLDQFTHLASPALDALDLFTLAGIKGRLGQEFAGSRDDHQGRAQLMADVAREQAFPLDGQSELSQGTVESGGEMTYLIVRIARRQGLPTRIPAIEMLHLPGKPGHRGHDLPRHDHTQAPGSDDAKQEAGDDHGKENLLPVLEFLLILDRAYSAHRPCRARTRTQPPSRPRSRSGPRGAQQNAREEASRNRWRRKNSFARRAAEAALASHPRAAPCSVW